MKPKLRKIDTWRFEYRGFAIKICHWNYETAISCCPVGAWNYYVYLPEKNCTRFSELWLEDQKIRLSANSPERIHHDYMSGLCGQLEMHGGITYYAKHGHTEGHRTVEVGCDYQHYGDETSATCRDENTLVRDAMQTVDHMLDVLQLYTKQNAPSPSN